MALKQTFTGDASKLNAELDKVNRAYAKMEEKLQRLTDESKKSEQAGQEHADSLKQSVGDGVTQLASLAAGWASIGQAIGITTDALARQSEQQQKNLDVNLQLAVQQQSLLLNAGKDFPSLLPQLRSIQEETNVSQIPLTAAASFAVSSKGELSNVQAMDAVRAAARMSPNKPEDIQVFTQAALSMMNAIGPGEVTPEEALGFAQAAAARAATAEPAQFFTNVSPVAFAGTIQDPTNKRRGAREAAALMTMFTGRGDPEGTISSTASINYMGKIAEFFKTQTMVEDPQSLFGRLGMLQQDESLREAFIAGGGLKGKLAGRVRTQAINLLDPNSPEAAALQAIGEDIQISAAPYQQRVGMMETATPSLRLAAGQRGISSAAEEFRLAHPGLGAQGLAREAVATALGEATGFFGNIQAMTLQKGYEWIGAPTMGPIEGGINTLQARRAGLQAGGVQPDEVGQIKMLDKQLQVLEGLRDDVRQGQGQVMAGAANEQPGRHAEN